MKQPILLLAFVGTLLFGGSCVSSSKYKDLENRYRNLEEEHKQTVDTLEKTRGELQDRSVAMEALQKDLDATKAEKERLQKSMQELDTRISDMKTNLASREAEIKKVQEEKSSLAKENETIRSRSSETETSLKKREADLQQEVAGLKDQLAKLDQEKSGVAAQTREVEMKDAQNELLLDFQKELQNGDVGIERFDNRLSVTIKGTIFFDSGSAKIKDGGKETLSKIAGALKKVSDADIYVEGHTDDQKIGPALRSRYPSNWELGAARASSVIRFLVKSAGMDPQRMSAVSHSYYRPAEDNKTAAGRAKNRRIQITLVQRRPTKGGAAGADSTKEAAAPQPDQNANGTPSSSAPKQ